MSDLDLNLALNSVTGRLDNAIKAGLVKRGTRFIYTVQGTGACYEGTLFEQTPLGHVKLNSSLEWHWPEEIRIEEILCQAQVAEPLREPVVENPADNQQEQEPPDPRRDVAPESLGGFQEFSAPHGRTVSKSKSKSKSKDG